MTITITKAKFDWFKNFPIPDTTYTLQFSPNGLKLLEFIKLPLANFYPGLPQHVSIKTAKNVSFNTFLKELAQQ